jgi:hypothetical protein
VSIGIVDVTHASDVEGSRFGAARLVVYRIMRDGSTLLFVTGRYVDTLREAIRRLTAVFPSRIRYTGSECASIR